MTNGTILILGARSDIGKAVAHRFAQEGYSVQLAARNIGSLKPDQADIKIRYSVPVSLHEFDALATESHKRFIDDLPELPDVAVSAVGYMGEQSDSEKDVKIAAIVIRTNFEGPASIFAELAIRFEEQQTGVLIGISSVAGERGRAINYVYGASKAGFTAFLSGMRNKYARDGIHIITVLPGYVATRMTKGMDLPSVLVAQPSEVADRIFKAVSTKQNVVYVRSCWRIIMLIIKIIPEKIFKRLQL
tara:strand:- start:1250 stop:1987 length:738 start_codon:yes stop_codon:yes gene_type:complete